MFFDHFFFTATPPDSNYGPSAKTVFELEVKTHNFELGVATSEVETPEIEGYQTVPNAVTA